jgi:hypothetical protein
MSTNDEDKNLGRNIGVGFIIVGSLLAIVGLAWLLWTASFVSNAAKALGQVTKMERGEGSEGGSMYHPIFTFTDASGIVHTQRSSHGSAGHFVEVGERVTVLYDATRPAISKIDSFETVWLGPVVITGFGLFIGGFASLWLLGWSRATRRFERRENVA